MGPYRANGSVFLVSYHDKLCILLFVMQTAVVCIGSMTEAVRVDPQEVLRRENYIREYQRPRNLRDPFTWKYPYRTAGVGVLLTLGGAHLHNLWMRKPWHYALYGRIAGVIAAGVVAYGLGTLRERQHRTKEAVTEHYKSLHPDDFTVVDDIYGRAFAAVLLPWYPRRPHYRDNRQ
uniref:NADH dehydrogenase [ubiquinone] 1 subunit C2 n=1 Tax=Panagrolaimus sp. JU765 TaxID=591449 RepID=A0AC34QHJ6_9BILA